MEMKENLKKNERILGEFHLTTLKTAENSVKQGEELKKRMEEADEENKRLLLENKVYYSVAFPLFLFNLIFLHSRSYLLLTIFFN